MEINKLMFENLKIPGVTESFESFDIDCNGVINEKDAALAENSKIKNGIVDLLNSIDEDVKFEPDEKTSLLKTGAAKNSSADGEKNEFGMLTVNKNNYEEAVLNSKGTVYVTIGSQQGCYYCREWQKAVMSNIDEISQYAQVYAMSYGSNKDLLQEIKAQLGIRLPVNFPFVVKFVDGKPVEALKGMRSSDAQLITNKLITKAEKGSKVDEVAPVAENQENSADLEQSSDSLKKTSAILDKTVVSNRYEHLYSVQQDYFKQTQDKLEKLNEKFEEIVAENKKIQKEIEEKQAKYNELVSKIEDAGENANVSSLQSEAEYLQAELSLLTVKFGDNNISISNMESQINSVKIALNAQKLSMKNTAKQIDLHKTTKVDDTVTIEDSALDSDVTDENGIDWSALYVEGKGININNFAALLDKNNSLDVDAKEIQDVYNNATDEQKDILKKFFDFNENGKLSSSKEYIYYFTHMLSTSQGIPRPMFESLAFQDSDGDGFLSEDEVSELKTKLSDHIESVNNRISFLRSSGFSGAMTFAAAGLNVGVHDMGIKVGMGDAQCAFAQTTVNGKKVYIGYTPKRGQLLTVTEDEMKIISEFLTGENREQYRSSNPKVLQPIWDALGAVRTSKGGTYTLPDGTTLTNTKQANVFVNSAGVICSYNELDKCTQCTNSFQMLYLGIRDMMQGKDIQYDRSADFDRINGKYVLKSEPI